MWKSVRRHTCIKNLMHKDILNKIIRSSAQIANSIPMYCTFFYKA